MLWGSLVTLASAAVATMSPTRQEVENIFDTLTPKEQELVHLLDAYRAEKEARVEPVEVKEVSKRDEVIAGVYNEIEVEVDAGSFSLRQMSRVDVEELLSDLIFSVCGSLQIVCELLFEDIIEDLSPELMFIQSLAIDASFENEGFESASGEAKLDLIAHLLSFPGSSETFNKILDAIDIPILPSHALAYFGVDSRFSADFNAASIKFDAEIFGMAMTYMDVIEFEDNNGNNLYDQGEEKKTIDLGRLGWKPSTYRTFNAFNSSAEVHRIECESENNQMKFICDTATYPISDPSYQILTPNATKCTFEINNFSYSGSNSMLAVRSKVALIGAEFSAGGSAEAAVDVTGLALGAMSDGIDGAFISWNQEVTTDVDDQSFAVSARVTPTKGSFFSNIITEIVGFASGNTYSDAREVFYTFKTTANPSKVVWDPAVGFGAEPVAASANPFSNPATAAAIIIPCVIAGVVLAVGVAYVFFGRRNVATQV